MKPAIPLLLVLFATCSHSQADTFVLKDGSQIEGRILSQDEDQYVIEVQVTRSIRDEKTVPKSEVVRIEREKPDLKAFTDIAALLPTPDALGSEQYAARIEAAEKFLREHPTSSKYNEARTILATLKQEANEILAGGIKIGGMLVSPADYRANALEIDARAQEVKIRELISSGNFLAGLRAFQSFDREFKGTEPHRSILPLIAQAITQHMNNVREQLASFDKRLKDREAGLSRMPFEDRRITQAAIAEELAAAEQRFKSEREARVGWVTIQPFLKATLEETLHFGKQELARIEAAIKQPPVDVGKAYRDALRNIQTATDASARGAAVSEARTAGVPPRYLAKLEAAAKP